MSSAILDVEQARLLLELEAPFTPRDVQLARRRMAKRWHPDIAPPGRQLQHERHLQAINRAADQLGRLAEQSRGGSVSANAVKASAAAKSAISVISTQTSPVVVCVKIDVLLCLSF